MRVPDSEFIREVSRGSGSVLALTSANLSGDRSSVCVSDFENLWQHCAYVYDGGLLPSGRAGSTIVDLSKVGKYTIIRPGRYVSERCFRIFVRCLLKRLLCVLVVDSVRRKQQWRFLRSICLKRKKTVKREGSWLKL